MNTSRIPVPRTSIKREASKPVVAVYNDESPSQQKAARIASKSPTKFTRPQMMPNASPATAVKRLSLAPNSFSPLATPPRRSLKGRLSMYGVPLTEKQMMSSKGSGLRRMTIVGKSGREEKRIVVCARKRPFSIQETSNTTNNPQDCILADMVSNKVEISVMRNKMDGLGKYKEDFSFNFDRVYDENCSNFLVYKQIVQPLVTFTLNGGKSTTFAYGQTGSGKTHTMFSSKDGLCFQAIEEIIKKMNDTLECHISFFEIYQSHLYDLLKDRRRLVPCEKSDGQVKIMGLEEELVQTSAEARESIMKGFNSRMTGKTGANNQSSRSHAILQYTLKSNDGKVYGRISFIDLAGSERGADRAEVDRKTKMEGSEINKSLLALKECIRAIDQDSSHLPFRQSKLTLVLKDSIVGDVRTAMIATVSPSVSSSEHTLNTLRYAERFHDISGPSLSHQEDENSYPDSPIPVTQIQLHSREPVKIINFQEPVITVESRRQEVAKKIQDIVGIVETCDDADALELLGEELSSLCTAVTKLTQ